MRQRLLFISWSLLLIIGCSLSVKATHIVGGEITYRCMGGNQYEITVDIYEDCLTGQQAAIDDDNPALIGIFYDNGSNIAFRRLDSIQLRDGDRITVPSNFSNSCINNPPPTCLYRARFKKTYTLPPSPNGYVVVYQRCCRNGSVINIANPANVGATYYCNIPPSGNATCNNSAYFKNYPPQIVCINNPLVYDHSATDPDNDSLSYEFCTAYVGGSPNDAKPDPTPPPFSPVNYISPYSAINPMRGFPQIKIDPITGIITGTPNLGGRYVVTVCCSEWRNGVKINTVTREFQFVVTDCSKAVVANTPVFSDEPNTYIVNCRDYNVTFLNTSTGGFEWFWDFGVNGATSSDFQPTFTYPDTGTYLVKLVVNRGSTCPDSITRVVKVYPNFKGDMAISGLYCPNMPLQFIDLSTTSYQPINYWNWDFGDSTVSSEQNPQHVYPAGGLYNLTFISGNAKGCRDTVKREVDIEKFNPFAGNDTVIVKGEYINFNASGGLEYTWMPATLLDNPNVNNPVAFFADTGYYRYNVHIKSSYGCEGNDSIVVRVVNQASYFVPSAFSPNNDGRNDGLKPIAVGYRSLDIFRVFNRFGEMVFESNTFGEGWDGTYKGNKMDIGTYFYMLKMTNRFGQVETAKGDAVLLR